MNPGAGPKAPVRAYGPLRYDSRLEDVSALPDLVRPEPDVETKRVARAFMRRIEGRYPVQDIILYGSRARLTHSPESDADIAVVLKGEPGDRAAVARDMAGIAFDVLMETGVLVEALPVWEDEFRHPERFSNPPLIRNIRREGQHF